MNVGDVEDEVVLLILLLGSATVSGNAYEQVLYDISDNCMS